MVAKGVWRHGTGVGSWHARAACTASTAVYGAAGVMERTSVMDRRTIFVLSHQDLSIRTDVARWSHSLLFLSSVG